jgi:hypothetical protein
MARFDQPNEPMTLGNIRDLGVRLLWSPTIRLIAETPWLDVFCPSCGTSRAIDLRTIDRARRGQPKVWRRLP